MTVFPRGDDMRIGFFHESAGSRHAGGIAIYVQRMAAALAEGNEVFLYTRGNERTTILRESAVEVVETPGVGDWGARLLRGAPISNQDLNSVAMVARGLADGFRRHVEDHVDVLLSFLWLDDLLLSNVLDVPTVYGFHRLEVDGFGGRLRDRFSRTGTLVANGDRTADRVAAVFGHDVDAVVYPGVDLERFTPDAEPAFAAEGPTVLFVGRLVESKGIFDLVDAVSRLEAKPSLHLVGAGDERELRASARGHGIEESVVFHGEVSHVDLPGYYAAADICCLPSYAESFGMVNVEAMACGTPVVTSRLAPIEAYLTDGFEGLLVDPGDTDALARSISRALDSPALRARLRAGGLERARAFSWDAQASTLESVCAAAAEREGAPGGPVGSPPPLGTNFR